MICSERKIQEAWRSGKEEDGQQGEIQLQGSEDEASFPWDICGSLDNGLLKDIHVLGLLSGSVS